MDCEVSHLNYEQLLTMADQTGLLVKEQPLLVHDGLISGKRIAIRKDIGTKTEKSCVLAEEIGHYRTSTGDILDQSKAENRKQELRARMWAYNKLIGLKGIIRCYEHRCHSFSEMAEYLEVTEEFLSEALKYYRMKYGICVVYEKYVIYFEPTLSVMKKIE